MNRKKFLLAYFSVFIFLYLFLFFGLKFYSQKKFNQTALNQLIDGDSKFMNVTNNLCQFQILGEPKVGNDYVKINFWCRDNSKARSTFSLIAFTDKTPTGILKEYARMVNFDFNLIIKNNWYCTLNDQEIDFKTPTSISQGSTIDCFENKGINKHD